MKHKTKLVGLVNIQDTVIDKSKTIETVSARELWLFLESKQDFSDWIKKRVNDYNFIEGADYYLVHKKKEQVSGTKFLIEYYVSLPMAKELAMVERNDKGKEIRKYFIQCEVDLKELQAEENTRIKARADARMEYKPMTDAILAIRGADAKPYHYSNEANLVYLVVMGATCKKLKEHLELDNLDSLRDALTPLQIQAVHDIQKHNTTLLEIEMNYDERKIQLNKLFYRKWAKKLLEEHIRLEA